MSKAKFDAAKELIQEKKYGEARALLKTIDHPTAREWEAKLDRIDKPAFDLPVYNPQQVSAQAQAQATALPPNRTTGIRIWRNVWGVLALISMGWLCYGLYATTIAFSQVATPGSSKATQTGAAIGSSIGIAGFLCTGLPFLILFLYAYGRAGATLRSERQHREMLEAVSRR